MKKYKLIFVVVLAIASACGSSSEASKGKGFNLFTIEDDIQLGAEVAAQIDADTDQFPLLDSAQFASVYEYVYKVRDKILASEEISYREEFAWRIRVIQDDSTLNAFCTPGGYIYVYTGILKFLDSEDQLAGVLGHEIAHADMRHSTRQMTKMYGVQVVAQVLAGNKEAIAQVAGGILGLSFSRKFEKEADLKSVQYLCSTDYNADGGAGFFIKINEMGGSGTPEFLSTHPDPGDRIEEYQNNAITLGCDGNKDYKDAYALMISKLP